MGDTSLGGVILFISFIFNVKAQCLEVGLDIRYILHTQATTAAGTFLVLNLSYLSPKNVTQAIYNLRTLTIFFNRVTSFSFLNDG